MFKFIITCLGAILISTNVYAKASDFYHYFDVVMAIELPDMEEYFRKLDTKNQYYNRGYKIRVMMGNTFKKEFSKTKFFFIQKTFPKPVFHNTSPIISSIVKVYYIIYKFISAYKPL